MNFSRRRLAHARRNPRWLLTVIAATALLIAGLPVSTASAVQPALTALDQCTTYSGLQICSGEVPTFDGSLLDVDLTLPASGGGQLHPLMVLLHRFGNDKHEWESTNDDAD